MLCHPSHYTEWGSPAHHEKLVSLREEAGPGAVLLSTHYDKVPAPVLPCYSTRNLTVDRTNLRDV